VPVWSRAAEHDLDAIRRHQTRYNGEQRADDVVDSLLDAADRIVARRYLEIVPGIRRVPFDGYVYLVTDSDDVEIVRVFAPGQDWLSWIKEVYPR
jgi:plasmid stabilization system protein ParE